MRVGVRALLLATLLASASISVAQVEIKGVGFDPTPVEIGNVPESSPRPMKNMDLLTMKNFYGAQISPDGKSVAFVVGQAVYDTNSYRSGLFVVDTAPGSVPKSLGSVGPARWDDLGYWDEEEPVWSPDSRYVAYRLRTDGIWQVWRWNRDGSSPLQLTHATSDVASFSWSKDGMRIDFDVKEPIAPEMIQQMEQRGVLYEGLTPVFQNRSIMQQELEHLPEEAETWILNVDSGYERRLTPEERAAREEWKLKLGDKVVDMHKWASGDQGNILDPKLSPDGTKAIFQLWNPPAVAGHSSFPLYIKKLGGGPPIAINPADAGATDVTSYWWSADGKHIYITAAGDRRSRYLYVISADEGRPVRLVPRADTKEYLDEFSVSDSGEFAVATLENSTTPPKIAFIDLNKGSVRILVDINPEFRNLKLSPATRIEWASKYGEPGYGYLIKPLDYKPGQHYPLIVTTYRAGGYFLRGAGGEEYPIQVFAANGFAVLAWDEGHRHADAENGNFRDAMLLYEWPAASLEAALNAVDKLGIVDRRRCGLTGYSFGTEIADFVVSHHPELFATAVTSGMSGHDPYVYYMSPKFQKERLIKGGLGPPSKRSWKRWREYSSSLNADRIKAPLLSNASEDDFMMDFEMYTTLEQLRKPVEMFIYPYELHTKAQPKHLFEIYKRNLDWFKFWLQGVEDPDPTKKAQYERWRHLRELHEADLSAAHRESD